MIRALWLTHVYPRDAADLQGLFLHRLAKELPQRGVEVSVLAPGATGALEENELDGIWIRRFAYLPEEEMNLAYTGEMHREAIRRPTHFMRFFVAMMLAASKEIARTNPDVIHAHWWFPAGVAARRSSHGRPFILSLHGTDMRLLSKAMYAWPLARWVIAGADRLLAVSEAVADGVQRLHLSNRRSEILPMPADVDVFYPDEPSADGSHTFVLPARLVTQKRIDVAIRAAAWVQSAGMKLTVHLVGEGKEEHRLRALAQELGVGNSFVFHGFLPQKELADLIRGARAVILPSEDEGYGLVLVEGALCERPAIGVRSGAIQEHIVHEKTGLLVDPSDYKALGRAMMRLSQDPELARQLGRNARARAMKRTAGPLADQLVEIYQEEVGTKLV